MIHALIRHKLSAKQENMEDILTSSVLGMMDLMDLRFLLLAFLKRARDAEKSPLFFDKSEIIVANYVFWPNFKEDETTRRCQPDVRIDIDFSNGPKYLLFVEAKFKSGKSSFNEDQPEELYGDESLEKPKTNDQLYKQWKHLQKTKGEREPVLLYLTADTAWPKMDIEESESCAKKEGKDFKCFWLSWRELRRVLGCEHVHKAFAELLDKLNLSFFEGFKAGKPPLLEDLIFFKQELRFQKCQNGGPNKPLMKLPIVCASLPSTTWSFKA